MLYGAINVAEMRKEWCRRRRCARSLVASFAVAAWAAQSERGSEGGEQPLGRGREEERRFLQYRSLAPQETIELGYLFLIA